MSHFRCTNVIFAEFITFLSKVDAVTAQEEARELVKKLVAARAAR
jgi:hypothetical protein